MAAATTATTATASTDRTLHLCLSPKSFVHIDALNDLLDPLELDVSLIHYLLFARRNSKIHRNIDLFFRLAEGLGAEGDHPMLSYSECTCADEGHICRACWFNDSVPALPGFLSAKRCKPLLLPRTALGVRSQPGTVANYKVTLQLPLPRGLLVKSAAKQA